TARLSRRPATPTVKTRRDQAAINTRIDDRRDRDDIGAGRARPARAVLELDPAARLVRALTEREVAIDPAVNG
ncbi:MAG: hypothetical protein NT062_10980, partial [Proteobacteria bacterium]|nr:hypothetical protein [Pseudomonadota bacterium]